MRCALAGTWLCTNFYPQLGGLARSQLGRQRNREPGELVAGRSSGLRCYRGSLLRVSKASEALSPFIRLGCGDSSTVHFRTRAGFTGGTIG